MLEYNRIFTPHSIYIAHQTVEQWTVKMLVEVVRYPALIMLDASKVRELRGCCHYVWIMSINISV